MSHTDDSGFERLLRPDEVASALRVSKRTVYTLAQRGELPACRIAAQPGAAGTIRFHPADVRDFVDRLRNPRPPHGGLPASGDRDAG